MCVWRGGGDNEKIILLIVATNVVSSRQSECRPTANWLSYGNSKFGEKNAQYFEKNASADKDIDNSANF